MSASPLIALAAGGTGGHMFPAEALAQELKRRGARVLLVTDARGRRYAETFPADESFEISAANPNAPGPVAKALAAVAMAKGLMTALAEFRKRGVSAAVGFGGYPSLPSMKAAALLRIPYGLHEQNGVLGRSNRLLAGGAAFTAHGFPALEKAPAKARLVEIGNPVRDAVAALAGAPYPASDEKIRLLIFGGSQGAGLFSEIPPNVIAGLPETLRRRLFVTHQAREADAAKVKAVYAAAGVPAEVAPFFADLPARIAAAHLVIGRAGASTVTELAVIGRPAILAPLAIAMDDHQTGNARALADAGAATIIPEAQFSEETLKDALAPLLAASGALAAMAAKAKGRVKEGAAAALADLTLSLVEGGNARKAA